MTQLTAASERRPIIVYISPGPTYYPHNPGYQRVWSELSETYEGFIFTTAPKGETIPMGRFEFRSMRSRNRLWDSFRFVVFCVFRALVLRAMGKRVRLVTTYDPLKSGLCGLAVAWIHGARFAPEVNGVYTSAAQWLDEPDTLSNRAKRRMYPSVMRVVLKHASGVKLLFPEQLASMNDILAGKVIRAYPSEVSTAAFTNIGEKKEILLVGAPFKLKGVDIMIEAFKRLAPAYPDWTLKILGWYPDPRQLQAAIAGHPQITHHPPVPGSQMPEHIGSCAIVVQPSRSEAMGRVLVEAMAARKPRVGSRVDGIPTVIDDGVDGYLVEPESVDDLADKLGRLMSDPELRRRMGQAGLARVPREFTQETLLKNRVAFYEEVIAS